MKHTTKFAVFAALASPTFAQRGVEFSALIQPSAEHAVTFDSARGRIVQFGGGRFGVGVLPTSITTTAETWEWRDGWTRRRPTVSPPASHAAALAFDAQRAVCVLFGGATVNGDSDETWTWDDSAWTRQRPARQPSARSAAAMAYDSRFSETLLFGGWSSGGSWNQDTWTWDGGNWTQRTPLNSPPAVKSEMIFDASSNAVLLVNLLGESWRWNGNDWQQLPRVVPAGEQILGMGGLAFDLSRSRAVLVGFPTNAQEQKSFEWDGTAWTVASPPGGSPGYNSGRIAFDLVTSRTIMVGGIIPGGQAPSQHPQTTQSWDGAAWTESSPIDFPLPLVQMDMRYHPASGEVLSFGGRGRTGGVFGDTWAWGPEGWSNRAPANAPSPRFDHAVALDANGDLTLFGGSAGRSTLADTWIWNGSDWSVRTPANGPSARSDHAMAFDAARGETVLFGGNDGTSALNDTWVWDGSNWQQRSPSTVPPALLDPSMTYDAVRDRVVLKGTGTAFWEWDGSDWVHAGDGMANSADLVFDTRRGIVVATTRFEFGTWDGTLFVRAARLADPQTTLTSFGDGAAAYHAGLDRIVRWDAALVGGSPPALSTFNESIVFTAFAVSQASPFGDGCVGSNGGTPSLMNGSVNYGQSPILPSLGATAVLEVRDLPTGAAATPVGLLGFDRGQAGPSLAPVALDPIGMPGCSLLVNPAGNTLLNNNAGRATWSFAIPNSPPLRGLELFTQVFVPDAGANALGLIATNAVALRIGDRGPDRLFP